jgi:hypothetical protein
MPPRGRRGNQGSGRGSGRGRGQIQPSIESQEESQLAQEIADSSISSIASDPDRSENDITPITILGQEYHRAKDGAGKGSKTSGIWTHGFEIIHAGNQKKHYYCRLCLDDKKDMTYKPLVINGTSTIRSHFRSKHGFDPVKPASDRERETSSRISTTSPGPGPIELVFHTILDEVKLLLIKWIVFSHIAFVQIENIYFKQLFGYLNPRLAKCLPTRNTFRRWVLAEFEKRKQRLKKELSRARSSIHISFDLWTSPNCYAIIALVAYYIDEKGCRQTKLLAIRQLNGEHSGENIAECVLLVFKEYNIRKRVGFFILDNASNNDTAVNAILCSLYPTMSETARKRRRIRCLAHVTNLVAKAFLLGQKSEETKDELQVAENQNKEDPGKLATFWQKHGALGRLQNLVRFIRMTPQRRQKFKECLVDSKSWKEFNRLEVQTRPIDSLFVPQYGICRVLQLTLS